MNGDETFIRDAYALKMSSCFPIYLQLETNIHLGVGPTARTQSTGKTDKPRNSGAVSVLLVTSRAAQESRTRTRARRRRRNRRNERDPRIEASRLPGERRQDITRNYPPLRCEYCPITRLRCDYRIHSGRKRRRASRRTPVSDRPTNRPATAQDKFNSRRHLG